MATKKRTLSDQIRQAIDTSGMSRYRICKILGIDQSPMSRFMSRKGGMTIETLDRLGEFLGLSIVVEKRPRAKDGEA